LGLNVTVRALDLDLGGSTPEEEAATWEGKSGVDSVAAEAKRSPPFGGAADIVCLTGIQ
jgi:hypothetical protein